MNFGLSETTRATIRRILEQHPKVEKAVIYGSRAKGNYKNGSDIDLTLIGDALDYKTLSDIAGELDDSQIPQTVDLSIYAKLNHAKLREHIDRVGVVFYERGGAGERSGDAGVKTGWPRRKLGDLCEVVGGGTPSKDNSAFYSGQIPWATVRDMRQDIITETECCITEQAVESSATHVIPAGNVVIATRVGLGKVCLLGQDTAINQDLRGIIPQSTKTLSVRFLFWWLKTMADTIIAEGTGATVQGVKLPFIKSLQIPLPPLPEQRRIVALLDEAFAGLAVAQANAEKNLQNARALFESHLNDVFSKRGEGWVERRLGECFRLKSGDGLTSKAMNGGRYPVYGGNGIAGTHDEFNLAGDNVIIGRVGALCGNARHISERIWLTDNAFKVVDRSFEFDEAFLVYLLNFKDLRSFARQAAQPVISNSSLQDVALAFPEIREQQRIAAQLDALSAETRRLAAVYERKLAALGALKKSLLHQAFAGGL